MSHVEHSNRQDSIRVVQPCTDRGGSRYSEREANMGDLDTTDASILTVKESIRRDNLALEDPRCTAEQVHAARQHKARCEILLRELWQHRLRLVTSRPR
jgi:hypothetical protein